MASFASPSSRRPENDGDGEGMMGSALPLILVVSVEEGVRQGLTSDIARRFGADYTVAAVATTDAALDRLDAQASDRADRALVIVDERLGNPCRPTSCWESTGGNRRPSGCC